MKRAGVVLVLMAVTVAGFFYGRRISPKGKALNPAEANAPAEGEEAPTLTEADRSGSPSRSSLNAEELVPVASSTAKAWDRVFGVVEASDELPLGESVRVRARWYEDGPNRRRGALRVLDVEADAEGAFEVPVSRQARGLRLDVLADFLGLESPLRIEKDSEGPIVLRPDRGGCLTIDFVGHAALDPEVVFGEAFMVKASVASGPTVTAREAFLGADGSLRIGGLPAEQGWWIRLEAQRFIDAEIAHPRIASRARSRVEIPVVRGVSAEGLVQAPDGSPVESATVKLRSWRQTDARNVVGREATVETDRDGRFWVGGVVAGEMNLVVLADGMVKRDVPLDERVDGEHIDASTIRMQGGARVVGMVRGSNGKPVYGAVVRAAPASRTLSEGEETKTGKDGRFEIAGMVGERFRVRASKRNRKTKRREVAVAEALDGVDVVLTLEDGLRVQGRVIDDEGTGISTFTVQAVALGADKGASTLSAHVKKGEGAFELVGLTPGDWELRATSRKYGRGERLRLSLPEDADPLIVTLPRLGSFSGTVVDPDGLPVAGAEVSVGTESSRSDEEGQFALESLEPGFLNLRIKVDGERKMLKERWTLAPGEHREGALCGLRRGGRIFGEIHESTRTGAEFDVSVRRDNVMTGQTVSVDEDGRFEFSGLEEGMHWVSLGVGNQVDWIDGYRLARPVPVVVPNEGDAHVVLGDPADYPIRLFGEVSRGGEPLAELLIYVYEIGGETVMPKCIARSEVDGSYEIFMRTPGRYLFGVGAGQMQLTRHVHEITGEAEQRLDFEIPSGTLRGRALLASGGPVGGRLYMLAYEGALKDTIRGGDFLFAHTRNDGSFQFESVSPGTYTLRTGNYVELHATDGLVLKEGIVVPEEGEPEEIDVMIPEGAVVDLVAQDAAGNSLPGCKILFETESGHPCLIYDLRKTNYTGMLRFTGVGAGLWNAVVEGPAGEVLGRRQVVVSEGARLRFVIPCGS